MYVLHLTIKGSVCNSAHPSSLPDNTRTGSPPFPTCVLTPLTCCHNPVVCKNALHASRVSSLQQSRPHPQFACSSCRPLRGACWGWEGQQAWQVCCLARTCVCVCVNGWSVDRTLVGIVQDLDTFLLVFDQGNNQGSTRGRKESTHACMQHM